MNVTCACVREGGVKRTCYHAWTKWVSSLSSLPTLTYPRHPRPISTLHHFFSFFISSPPFPRQEWSAPSPLPHSPLPFLFFCYSLETHRQPAHFWLLPFLFFFLHGTSHTTGRTPLHFLPIFFLSFSIFFLIFFIIIIIIIFKNSTPRRHRWDHRSVAAGEPLPAGDPLPISHFLASPIFLLIIHFILFYFFFSIFFLLFFFLSFSFQLHCRPAGAVQPSPASNSGDPPPHLHC